MNPKRLAKIKSIVTTYMKKHNASLAFNVDVLDNILVGDIVDLLNENKKLTKELKQLDSVIKSMLYATPLKKK